MRTFVLKCKYEFIVISITQPQNYTYPIPYTGTSEKGQETKNILQREIISYFSELNFQFTNMRHKLTLKT